MSTFRIGRSTFQGLERFERALKHANRVFPGKWKKALDDAGDIAQKYYLKQFESEGAEFGSKWAALAPGTQAGRQRKGYKPKSPILVRRGWLRSSVVDKRSANHKRVVTKDGLIMESTLRTKSGLNMFILHQEGGGKLPARPISREGNPPFISQQGWNEIRTRFLGMFFEIRREMESV